MFSKIKRFFLDRYKKSSERRIRKRFRKTLGGSNHCYISQNCIGGRFYRLQKRGYTSPTVGLWFESSGFLKFCENLKENLAAEVFPDLAETNKMGYPVGRVNGIKIFFQHYPTFDDAALAWRKRASRVSLDDVVVLMTDRDGFTETDLKKFNELAVTRKILFSHKRISGNRNVVYVPGYQNAGCVGDLHGSYYLLNRPVVRGRLFKLLSQE